MIATEDARHFLFQPKRVVVGDHGWQSKGNRNGQTETYFFEGRVQIGASLPRACWFRASVWARFPETFKFQLECDLKPARTHLTLYRLEVKPFSAHPNSLEWGPEEFRGRFFDVGESHEHWCLDHVVEEEDRVRSGGVYNARPLEADISDYASGLAYVCDKLSIENREDIPSPKAQGSLFGC